MTTAELPLPLNIEQITPQWLGAVLSRPDRAVVVREVAGTGVVWGTATKVLVDVRYASGGDDLPTRLCIKGGFVPELLATLAFGYQAEVRFYLDVAPLLGDGLARCHYAEIDGESGQGVIILDDLASQGATFCDARRPLSVDHAAAALELLARWHARTDLDVAWLHAPPHYRPMARALVAAQPDGAIEDLQGPVAKVLTSRDWIRDALRGALPDDDID
jgi:hypothetical protein